MYFYVVTDKVFESELALNGHLIVGNDHIL